MLGQSSQIKILRSRQKNPQKHHFSDFVFFESPLRPSQSLESVQQIFVAGRGTTWSVLVLLCKWYDLLFPWRRSLSSGLGWRLGSPEELVEATTVASRRISGMGDIERESLSIFRNGFSWPPEIEILLQKFLDGWFISLPFHLYASCSVLDYGLTSCDVNIIGLQSHMLTYS